MRGQMKNKLYLSQEAQRDLDEIWDYIASELGNTAAAEQTVGAILDDIDQLRNFAELGVPLFSIARVESDHRVLVTGNYLTFYRVGEKEVYVDRVLYGRRDYLCALFGEPEKK